MLTLEQAISILVAHRNNILDASDAELHHARDVVKRQAPKAEWYQTKEGVWALSAKAK